MTVNEILKFEDNDGTEIHLVRDRLFWQAWERSAFLFSKFFRKYQVHHKFVQKVSCDLVWLGFPKNVLPDLRKTSIQNNFIYSKIDDSHIVIKGVSCVNGYEEWKSGILSTSGFEENKKEDEKKFAKTSEYLLYRLIFDFVTYSLNLVPKVNRVYRFSVCERVILELMNSCEHVYLHINHYTKLDNGGILQSLLRIRLDFRLLNELHQISIKQWMYVNQKIDEILKIVSPEFMSLRIHEDGLEESSILPATLQVKG